MLENEYLCNYLRTGFSLLKKENPQNKEGIKMVKIKDGKTLNDLIRYDGQTDDAVIEDSVLAEALGVEERNFKETIKTHTTNLERLGVLRFATVKGKGRPKKITLLNRDQTVYLISRSQSENASEFMVQYIQMVNSALHYIEAVRTKTAGNIELAEAVRKSGLADDNKFMYATVHNLAWNRAFGISASNVKQLFDIEHPQEFLNDNEMKRLDNVQDKIKAGLILGFSYKQIKNIDFGEAKPFQGLLQ